MYIKKIPKKTIARKNEKSTRGARDETKKVAAIFVIAIIAVISVFAGSIGFYAQHNARQQLQVVAIKLGASTVSNSLLSLSALNSSREFGFSIYTNLTTLLSQFKTYYSTATAADLLMDDVYSNANPIRTYLSYFDKSEPFPRLILANNYSELTSTTSSPYVNDVALAKAYNFTSSDYIAYDTEDWALTPLAEQNNEAEYTQMACNYVHNAGYRFAFTPEIDVPGWGQLAKVNWTCVNLLDLQEQFMSGNPLGLITNVTQMLAVSKAKNPNLIVLVQLDMQMAGSIATMESDILAMSEIPGVNGVIIEDLCSSASCNSELTTLVGYTTSLGGVLTFTTTTSSTTTITTSTTTPTSASTSASTTTTIAQKNPPILEPSPTCSGTPSLALSPNPSTTSASIIATVSGLSNCNGITITIKNYQGCTSGSTITTFSANATGGNVVIPNLGSTGKYGYYACVNSLSSAKAILTISNTATSITTTSTTITTSAPTTTTIQVTTKTTSTTTSSTTTIPASCSGVPSLSISPNPDSSTTNNVTATVSGLSNCNGYTITIKNYKGCTSGSTIATFTANATGGSILLPNPGPDTGQYGYYASANSQCSAKAIITLN